MIAHSLAEHIEKRRAEVVGFLAALVRANSSNPPGDTRKVADLVAARLRQSSIDFQILADEPRKPNVIARIGTGKPEILFTTHMDTVPAGDPTSWRRDPFGAEIAGARLFGRGAADAKASLAAMVAAFEALTSVLPLRGTLTLTAVSDEEVGGIKGTEFLVDRGLLRPDHVVVGEITQNRLAVAEKGVLWLRIITHGRAAHGSTPWDGNNAIDHMVTVLLAIREQIVTRLERMTHPLTPPPSISVGTIRGGVATNIVADWCEATIDRRTLPNESVQEAVAEVERLIAALRARNPRLDADVEVLQMGPPIETPVSADVVVAGQAVATTLGLDPAVVGYHQASDGRFFAERGIPTMLFGPGDPEIAHTANESVDLDEVLTAAQFYALLGQRMLTPGTGNGEQGTE
ncbi:MAG TPA: M20 family metallopeptidase [bacterium]|jgi:acetylornithine deacetylase/succinyl-diaminopimelate desuccinylase family protein|nr:M20 family metallopeptidase [bacterium]